jgi:plastocyanin
VSAAAPTRLGAALAIALALLVATLAGSAAAAAPTPTEGCTWQRHSKAVFKRVHRHGRARRVKRLRHWWTCEATQAAPLAPPGLPAPATTAPTAGEEPAAEPEVGHLGVKAVEYSYTLSRPEVSSGEVIVELNNQGEDPHNLVLEHEGSADPLLEIPSTPSTAQTSSDFTLSPGTYRLYCSLYKHEAKGMEATLVVGG